MFVTLDDVLAATAALAALDEAGAPDAALDRAAERIIARARVAQATRRRTGRAHLRFGDGGLAAAAHSLRREGPHRAAPGCGAMLRSAARLCAILAPPRPNLSSARNCAPGEPR
jgi:hypothetical protein